MALGSKSAYFKSNTNVLTKGWLNANLKLRDLGYNEKQIEVFKEAYEFFCVNPERYDGATASQDLYDISFFSNGTRHKLELWSMLHDYLYIIGAYYYKDAQRRADKILINQMKNADKSGAEITKRKFLLFILREIINYTLWKRLFNRTDYKAKSKYNLLSKLHTYEC